MGSTGGRRGRGVSGKRAVRALKKTGYYIDRIHGDHFILRHPFLPQLNIPDHKELKQGLLLSQIKRANLTWQDFERLL